MSKGDADDPIGLSGGLTFVAVNALSRCDEACEWFMPIYDISLPLITSLVTWPGDPPITLHRVLDMARGDVPPGTVQPVLPADQHRWGGWRARSCRVDHRNVVKEDCVPVALDATFAGSGRRVRTHEGYVEEHRCKNAQG